MDFLLGEQEFFVIAFYRFELLFESGGHEMKHAHFAMETIPQDEKSPRLALVSRLFLLTRVFFDNGRSWIFLVGEQKIIEIAYGRFEFLSESGGHKTKHALFAMKTISQDKTSPRLAFVSCLFLLTRVFR